MTRTGRIVTNWCGKIFETDVFGARSATPAARRGGRTRTTRLLFDVFVRTLLVAGFLVIHTKNVECRTGHVRFSTGSHGRHGEPTTIMTGCTTDATWARVCRRIVYGAHTRFASTTCGTVRNRVSNGSLPRTDIKGDWGSWPPRKLSSSLETFSFLNLTVLIFPPYHDLNFK